jgi:soluble lytic murein transglycosylase-like protein
MLLAGAALVAPRAGSAPVARPPATESRTESRPREERQQVAEVTVATEFSLPANIIYEELIQEAALRFALAPALIRAVIRTESAFNASAISSAGAQGLMQLMPELASEMGVTDPFDPRENIMAGSQYLSALLSDHGGDLELALASYNAGPGAVDHYGGVPPFEETQRYVRRIVDLVAASEDEENVEGAGAANERRE